MDKLIDRFIKIMVEKGASDLHLLVPSPPVLRIDGKLIPQTDLPQMTPELVNQIFESIASPQQVETFHREQELDFSYSVAGLARSRVNVLKQRGTIGIAFRLISFTIRSIDDLGLPQILKELVLAPRGLILLTGHAGSGKSTTLAAMINHLNKHETRNIITIEDPIEYLYHNDKCVIIQRDLGDDTRSFAAALKFALRHDPDVIVVGEMRDLETISTALTAAETGHLVIGTLHTLDAAQTIDRVIDLFPPNQQHQVAVELSQILVAVISQHLLPHIGGGRVAACEILTANPAVRNLIREGKVFQLPGIMQIRSKDGMQTLNQVLADFVKRHIVTRENAMVKTSDPEQLIKLINSSAGITATAFAAPEAGG
ncbi:MAG TPA: type IV pilus twitching motility protein PilT [Dehalococcoidales bacterium]